MEASPNRDHGLPPAAAPGPLHSSSSVRLPAEDESHSLAEMARRDLDAALQLLADRAQYITGATGAAIALRRVGKNDMQCRASTGSNAPELGSLLSTEYGLSGESVRTRQALRCDDAERDARVNREVCRHLGIASVIVMPVVNDEEVLGVFELFSGRVNAFGERDLSTVQRLSEMVETAVRLADTTLNLPARLKANDASLPAISDSETEEDRILEAQALETRVSADSSSEELILEDVTVGVPEPDARATPEPAAEPPAKAIASAQHGPGTPAIESSVKPVAPAPAATTTAKSTPVLAPFETSKSLASEAVAASSPKAAASGASAVPLKAAVGGATTPRPAEPSVSPSTDSPQSKNSLFWSAALHPAADAAKLAETDQSHVPPMLRGLQKCEACGFPVSAGRALCVECEEKKWRGQLKPSAGSRPGQVPAPAIAVAPKAEPQPLAAASQSAAGAAPAAAVPGLAKAPSTDATAIPTPTNAQKVEPATPVPTPLPVPTASSSQPANPAQATPATPSADALPVAPPRFVFSAGLPPSQSWFAANKYILAAVAAIAMVIVAVILFR